MIGALLILFLGAQAGVYTMLDGVLVELRAAHSQDGEPLLVGLPGPASFSAWEGIEHGSDRDWLTATVAGGPEAMRRELLKRGLRCGVLVQRYGKRGYETAPLCAAPTDVTLLLHGGQRLSGRASPGDDRTLRLQLAAGSALTVPLDAVVDVMPP